MKKKIKFFLTTKITLLKKNKNKKLILNKLYIMRYRNLNPWKNFHI